MARVSFPRFVRTVVGVVFGGVVLGNGACGVKGDPIPYVLAYPEIPKHAPVPVQVYVNPDHPFSLGKPADPGLVPVPGVAPKAIAAPDADDEESNEP